MCSAPPGYPGWPPGRRAPRLLINSCTVREPPPLTIEVRMKPNSPLATRKWTPLTIANAGLALVLEIGLIAALCFWGLRTGDGALMKVLLGVGAPVLAGTVWGLFLAAGGPKYTLPPVAYVVL